MKSIRLLASTFAFCLLLTGVLAQADPVSGTVTNKTNGKPAAGDAVAMLDVQASMAEVAHATTDAHGRYKLNAPAAGPYLVRVTHQGAGYFIAAPQGGGPGDISVYDVAAKVKGVSIEAYVVEIEAQNGQINVDERYFVHNTSAPPLTQWSQHSFPVVLPAEAAISSTGAQRPNGLPVNATLNPDGAKGHYAFDFPIQPDAGDKDTLFQVIYTLPYNGGSFTFHPQLSLPADNVAILLPNGIRFTPVGGASFQSVQADPGIQTMLIKNAAPAQALGFSISGTGSMPREAQGGQQGDNGGQSASAPGNQPGGGLGTPIGSPDPLSKYKWWILGGLALLLAAAAAFLLRRPAAAIAPAPAAETSAARPARTPHTHGAAHTEKRGALLNELKEELFNLESEKLSGNISAEEYAEQKAALEALLKRALKKNS
jgi:hypothetical protein